MSWAQGVHVREDMPPRMIESLEAGYERATGECARVEYVTWFAADGSDAIAHFDSNRGFRIGVPA